MLSKINEEKNAQKKNAYRFPCKESLRTGLIPLTRCDGTCEMLSTRETNQRNIFLATQNLEGSTQISGCKGGLKKQTKWTKIRGSVTANILSRKQEHLWLCGHGTGLQGDSLCCQKHLHSQMLCWCLTLHFTAAAIGEIFEVDLCWELVTQAPSAQRVSHVQTFRWEASIGIRQMVCIHGLGTVRYSCHLGWWETLASRFLDATLGITVHIGLFSSVAQSCLTLCDPMNHSTPGLPVHHQLPESTQTHVHRVGDAIQPSRPLSSPSPPALSRSFKRQQSQTCYFCFSVQFLYSFGVECQPGAHLKIMYTFWSSGHYRAR